MAPHLGSSSTTPAKTQHYVEAMSAALLAGSWGDRTPVRAPNGSELAWSEAIRKWNKHTGGNSALIHALCNLSLVYLSASAPAGSNQRLSSAYEGSPQSSASHPDPPSDASGSTAGSFVHVARSTALGKRSSLPDIAAPASGGRAAADGRRSMDVSRRAATPVGARGQAPLDRLRTPADGYLSAAGLDRDDGEDVILREHGGWWAGVPRERVAEVEAGLKDVEVAMSGAQGSDTDLAIVLKAYHLHALRRHDEALAALQRCSWGTTRDAGDALSPAARASLLAQGRCIQGTSYELTSAPQQALECYCAALSQLLQIPDFQRAHAFAFLSDTPPSTTQASPRTAPAFPAYRESLRWISTALCRGAVLSARGAQHDVTLRWLRDYHAFAHAWPASFRPRQRMFMLNLYMRALHAACPADRHALVPPEYQWSTQINLGETATGSAHQIWTREVRQAMQHGQELLAATTSFPRAGEVNGPVTDYIKGCVALWQKGGCSLTEGRTLSKILWWAMTMTFHSQPLLRSLTLILQAIGSVEDAKRTFELYVALVLKARQTSQPEVALQLERGTTDDRAGQPAEIAQHVAAEHVSREDAVGSGLSLHEDTDEEFLSGLLLGVRLLTRDLGDAKEAWRYAILAGEVIEKAITHIDLGLKAKVEASKGIVRMAMALHDADPDTRATWQAQGIDHLVASTLMDHSNSHTFYHLAYARAEARDIAGATFSNRTALELDSKNVEAWHLLALLRTADKDWQGALKAVEVGLQTWETAESSLAGPDAGQQADSSLSPRDFAVQGATPTAADTPAATSPARHALISGSVLLPAANDQTTARPPLPASKRLEMVIQLRMTEAVIVEKLHGQEVALQRQQESFAFFSARSGYSRLGGASSSENTASVRTQSMRERPGSFSAATDVAPRSSAEMPGAASSSAAPYTATSPISPPRVQVDAAPSQEQFRRPSAAASFVSQPEDADEHDPHRRPKFLPKHLHVPGTRRSGRSSSLSQHSPASGLDGDKSMRRSRTISDGSSIFSRAPTPAHSHYHGTRSPPAVLPPQPAAVPTGRTPAETRVLCNLWLMSAATFRRTNQLQQALVAIQEAELMDPENADVWLQLGLYHVEVGDRTTALESFAKALVLRPEYSPAVVSLAIVYFKLGQIDMAHGLLNGMTQANGWDVPEAFLWLAKVCEKQDRPARAQELLRFALTLERTRTCRPIETVVARFL